MDEPAYLPPYPSSFRPKTSKETAIEQGTSLAVGAAVGAMTKQTMTANYPMFDRRNPNLTMQVGSAMGSAASSGAGVGGTLAAGGAVVLAKAGAVATAATVAAPFVLGAAAVGAVAFGIYKLFADD